MTFIFNYIEYSINHIDHRSPAPFLTVNHSRYTPLYYITMRVLIYDNFKSAINQQRMLTVRYSNNNNI